MHTLAAEIYELELQKTQIPLTSSTGKSRVQEVQYTPVRFASQVKQLKLAESQVRHPKGVVVLVK